MNTNPTQTKQTLSFLLFTFYLSAFTARFATKKKRAYINTKSYFIYFKTPLYNLSNILFIIFHITLNTVHFLFISLSFSLSLSLHSSVSLFSLFTHISNPIAKKRKKKKKKNRSSHYTPQESITTTITTTIIITYPYQNSNK